MITLIILYLLAIEVTFVFELWCTFTFPVEFWMTQFLYGLLNLFLLWLGYFPGEFREMPRGYAKSAGFTIIGKCLIGFVFCTVYALITKL